MVRAECFDVILWIEENFKTCSIEKKIKSSSFLVLEAPIAINQSEFVKTILARVSQSFKVEISKPVLITKEENSKV